MSKRFPAILLRMVRNQIPIDDVITQMLRIDIRYTDTLLRFRCPLCGNFHTATNSKTNLARCFDCEKNFNPIDLMMEVTQCSFVEAVERLQKGYNARV